MKTKAAKKNSMGRAEDPYPVEISYADGVFLFDSSGKRYIDFLSGWCVGNLGWGNMQIKNALHEAALPPYVYPHLRYGAWDELSELLAELAPGDLEVSYRTTGGSESVDAALQMASLYTQRQKFISIEGSYHGNTWGALSIGDSSARKVLKNLLPGCLKLDLPLDTKAIRKVETLLRKKDVAAFVMEPVIINLGVHAPGNDFMIALRELCDKYGTLLVLDEVATGFGRTGKLFASQHYEVVPDIMCLGKAISGGYGGLGAVMTSQKVARRLKKFILYSTFGWHPHSTAAAIANLKYWRSNGDEVLKNVSLISELFRIRLSDMKFKSKMRTNIKGLAIATDVKRPVYAKNIQQKCMKDGLFFDVSGSELMMFPPLVMDEVTASEGLDILEKNC